MEISNMKVLMINGSPRQKGNTSIALAEIAKQLEKLGIESEIVWIGNKPVRGCIACNTCKDKPGACVFDDDVCNGISAKMNSSDALIVGSPVYWGQPNGAVLSIIQRAFYSNGAAFRGKPAAAVDENGNRIIDVNGHWKEVTFTNMDEADAVIEFSYDGETWYVWDGEPLNFANDGTYVIYVRATATGKTVSDVNTVTVVITPKTSVDELVNGKAVAGVRYFNMAGQEMQEANGVTIVVTTYTDGTTSAVKVIK